MRLASGTRGGSRVCTWSQETRRSKIFPRQQGSGPVRERVARSFPALLDQLRNSPAAPQQRFKQLLESIPVVLQPLRRNPAQGLVEYFRREIYNTIHPRLEVRQ